jgi:hypothetical protein
LMSLIINTKAFWALWHQESPNLFPKTHIIINDC